MIGQSALCRLAESRFAWVAMVLLCLAAYAPGLFTIPPIDRDESRFAQASRQMFESVALPEAARSPELHKGGLAVPYVQDRARLNKPPLIYWLQALSAAAWTMGDPLRDAIWMYRIPSVLCAVGAVLATWRLACSMNGRMVAFLAAAALAVSPVVVLDAHQARADQLLLLTVVLAQAALWKIGRGDRRLRIAVLFWVFVGAGILAKGPITPMIAALTAVAWSVMRREWRWLLDLRPIVGVFVVAALIAPWVVAVANHVGFAAYWKTIWGETVGRSMEAKEGHWGPPGYHLLLVFFLLWPVSLGIPGAVAGFVRAARARSEGGVGAEVDGWRERLRRASVAHPAEAFLLAWIVPGWIVFEFVGTKLPHYTLPLYPALCILASGWLFGRASAGVGTPRGAYLHWTRFWFGTGVVVLSGIGVLALSLSWWGPLGWWTSTVEGDGAPRTNWLLIVPIVVMLGVMIAAGRALARMRAMDAIALASVASVIGFGLLLGAVAPAALSLPTRVVGAAAARSSGAPMAMSGYTEDSLIYLTRGRVLRSVPKGAPHLLIASERSDPRGGGAGANAAAIPGGAALLRGFNIAKGRCESVLVLPPTQTGTTPRRAEP